MKTMHHFLDLIRGTNFFGNVGNKTFESSAMTLSSLAPWGDETNALDSDNEIADQMKWLPTARDQKDPFYPNGLDEEANNKIELMAAKEFRMNVYKALLAKLRTIDMTHLKAGSNSFEEAAKGAAAYALRNAATEIALGIDGKWLEVAEFYFKGHWPCGYTQAGKLVII